MREFELVDHLRRRLKTTRADTRLGIGDDGAVLAPPAGTELAVTTDTLIAGRHFPVDATAFDIGYKAAAVNLSDIAAMGAAPAWLTVALAAPTLDAAWCGAFVDGLLTACSACPGEQPIDIVGGDTTRAECLMISVTAIGQVPAGRAVRRSGARIGDVILVTGTLGDAAAGLDLWARRHAHDATIDALVARLNRPPLRRGSALAGRAHAAVDISDGFLADLGHILAASGVGARVDIDLLPAADALADVAPDAATFRRWQAAGGDDYELCITAAPDQVDALRDALGCALTVVGEIVAEPGLVCLDRLGRTVAPDTLGPPGWDHFDPG